MRRIFATLLLVIVALSSPAGFSASPLSGPADAAAEEQAAVQATVWVANRDADNVTVFDAATGAVIRTLASGRGAHDIAISNTAGKAYVTNELEDTVSVISTSTLQVLRRLTMPRPHHAKVSPDGARVYVGLFNNNLIAAIDTSTDQVYITPSSLNPNVKAHAPRASVGGRIVFVPHEVGDEVTALDASNGQLLGSVNIGSMPTEVLPAADGRRLFVAMRGEGRIKVIDLTTVQVVGAVDVGTQPEAMILANDQATLVSTLRGNSPASLAFVDAARLTLIGRVAIAGSGTFGDLAVASADGRYAYATYDAGAAGTGGVAVVDLQTGQRAGGWVYPGAGRPHGIAYSTTGITLP
jgi:DNA-binding beta-propeller fold protein YncE